MKNNFYFDYGLKFVLRSAVYNFLIHTAYFFAEKYMIEYPTRYVFNYFSARFYTIAFSLHNNKLLVFTTLAALNLGLLII